MLIKDISIFKIKLIMGIYWNKFNIIQYL